jgi:hypothetical protein
MTYQHLKDLFPWASDDFIRANSDPASQPPAVVERDPQDEPLRTHEVQENLPARFLVRVTTARKRLCDEDNLCCKWVVDCLRTVGIIPDDRPDIAHIEVRQRKVGKEEKEHTIIEVIPQA